MSIFLTGANGYVGGTVAMRLIEAGYSVRGLVRDEEKARQVKARGIDPVVGSLDDVVLLTREAQASQGVIHTADSDHLPAVEAFIEALQGSGKPFLHTSGSSVIGDDAQGVVVNPQIFDEDTPFVVAESKQPRRDIELKVLASAGKDIRAVVICPSNIYGTGTGVHTESVQIPWLVQQARESGVVRIVGSGVNRWSNVHVLDIAELYLLALQKAPGGAFYFAENSEASFLEIGRSIALRLGLGPVQFWTVAEAAKRWGHLHAHYTFGTNSRVRAKRARQELGWVPRFDSALKWIEEDMPR
ncbi:NAD-dependent epimerase/dehydratase family protein [Pseudomonas gingeri]|uniref:NAD-dependent epimerase/dehydratase family protein n=1 Tax=Pseudomonas gingeri TaxID=117681 RepID=UPI0015A0C27F|nr:NAD-dependent epimerase/dehydratase family protein [Pseudomonas gingeri]NWA24561.1 NAD-dependent epimerase/dehydratase family protein [Pseudomonas gingeri]NWD67180.1 NAD-dependent epimerase/dehydratase family protein [Pseudomonas gingeri]NWD77312.1 NAD-dependent epimerase/dehydratase family protein [Pseudomonas gingeri]